MLTALLYLNIYLIILIIYCESAKVCLNQTSLECIFSKTSYEKTSNVFKESTNNLFKPYLFATDSWFVK